MTENFRSYLIASAISLSLLTLASGNVREEAPKTPNTAKSAVQEDTQKSGSNMLAALGEETRKG